MMFVCILINLFISINTDICKEAEVHTSFGNVSIVRLSYEVLLHGKQHQLSR